MELTYLQTFREVALRQSFTRAAEELDYAQSSVTTQIQKLEKEYGVKLFERYGRGLRLTMAGEELLQYANQILDLYQQSKESLAKQGGGTLSIGTIDSLAAYYLPPIIHELKRKYGNLSIRLQPDREDHIMEKISRGNYHIGLMLGQHHIDSSLRWITIRNEPLLLIGNPQHPLLRYSSIELEHLREAEWILPEDGCNYRIMLEKLLRAHHIPVRIGIELGNPESIKRYVMSGTGIALLPQMVVDQEIKRGELSVLPFTHSEIQLDIMMVIHPKKWVSHAQQELMDRMMAEPE
ncbi:LysR family transcriptional regulator [Paenibacillus sp. JCM 10914]|uniref:LysR family transcriptional regulator n=1 Tax=Paenibacillus sp. JCM 10914 TaxID=1236974 RepID=UPI0003CC5520|nr:LysR family transcriptional regulator [Paenibacillus sp. JCM 10914]GAE08313.1 transcriptional regulator, LysR family [Paenibacillus sp. JCM 10914]